MVRVAAPVAIGVVIVAVVVPASAAHGGNGAAMAIAV